VWPEGCLPRLDRIGSLIDSIRFQWLKPAFTVPGGFTQTIRGMLGEETQLRPRETATGNQEAKEKS